MADHLSPASANRPSRRAKAVRSSTAVPEEAGEVVEPELCGPVVQLSAVVGQGQQGAPEVVCRATPVDQARTDGRVD